MLEIKPKINSSTCILCVCGGGGVFINSALSTSTRKTPGSFLDKNRDMRYERRPTQRYQNSLTAPCPGSDQ